jgi:hypothetical protein
VKEFSAAMGHVSQSNLHAIVSSGRINGLDFNHEDVTRAEEIYGPDLQAVRGKSVKRKNRHAGVKPAGKIVDANLIMHTDIMFVEGLPFLMSIFKPLMLLLSCFIRSKSTGDVKAAIEKQKATVQGEGFKVVEVTSDGEGAILAYADELRKQGCGVTMHGKATHSVDIDNKIRQVKNGMRSSSVLPYTLFLALVPFLVMFAVHKINLLPSRANNHGYSPMELFLGRSISLERDLGARGPLGKPLAFGSRVEIFDKTDNTMADRTTPALFLGSKSNSYGSSWYFKLDTESVVSREQHKDLPMDMGTIDRVNSIARKKGRPLRGKIAVFFRGVEVTGDGSEEEPDVSDLAERPVREVVDSGNDAPDMTEAAEPRASKRGMDVIRAEEQRADPAPFELLVPEDERIDRPIDQPEQGNYPVEKRGADRPTDQPDEGHSPGESRGAHEVQAASVRPSPRPEESVSAERAEREMPRWHVPEPTDGSSVDTPWFLAGRPLQLGEPRVRRQPDRLAFVLEDCNSEDLEEVYAMLTTEPEKLRKFSPFRPSSARSRVQSAQLERTRARHESAFVISVQGAIDQFGDAAVDSLMKELVGLDAKGVFRQVKLKQLNERQRKRIIRSKMFLKEKFFPDGKFDKLKSRYVAGGHMQRKDEYSGEDTSSPTVSLTSVYLVASIAAREKRKVATMDIGTAYLNASMKREVIMRVESRLAKLLVKINPDRYQLDADGCIYVVLEKALYGCVESARLWYEEISSTLLGAGLVANGKDPCVFNIVRGGHQITVCLYVDDLLVTSVDNADLEWVAALMRAKYKTVTLNNGLVHSYLGQTFDFSEAGEVSVSMEGYVRDVLDGYEVTGYRVTPATANLYDVTDGLELSGADTQAEFHSRVMKLMFLAQRARPDILTPVAFLSSRCAKCTSEDESKLDRVLMYLNSTPDLKMTLCASGELRVYAYVDASFAVHADMKSHTGGIISLGSGSTYVVSKKQQLMTKSSTEAELVGVSDVLPQMLWVRDFLIEQGHVMGSLLLYQDNQSTITMAKKGRSTSARTRHVAIRYFFIKDRMDVGEVEIEYLPTEDMRADILTKPLQGDLFRLMRQRLMGLRMGVAKSTGPSNSKHEAKRGA